MNKKHTVLIIVLMLVAFSLSLSLKLENLNKGADLTGKAYNSLNLGPCVYCTEYCGTKYPHPAGMILPLKEFRVKALSDGCTEELSWAPIHKDIKLCCQ